MAGDSQSSCEGKHRFDSQSLAREIARKSARRHEQKICAYECKHCGGWHVGQLIGLKITRHRKESND